MVAQLMLAYLLDHGGVVLELAILPGVVGHVVDVLDHVGGMGQIGRDFHEVSAHVIVDDPLAHVVNSGGIITHHATAVAHVLDVVGIVAPRVTSRQGGTGEGIQGFDKREAVELVNINREHLLVGLKGVGDIRGAEQPTRVELDEGVGIGKAAVVALPEQVVDEDGVGAAVEAHLGYRSGLGLVLRSLSGRAGEQE